MISVRPIKYHYRLLALKQANYNKISKVITQNGGCVSSICIANQTSLSGRRGWGRTAEWSCRRGGSSSDGGSLWPQTRSEVLANWLLLSRAPARATMMPRTLASASVSDTSTVPIWTTRSAPSPPVVPMQDNTHFSEDLQHCLKVVRFNFQLQSE